MTWGAGSAERDEEVGQESYTRRSRVRVLSLLVGALVMAGFAGAIWFAYHETARPTGGDAPLIRADGRPLKTRPEQPGGMSIPNQDKFVYNNAGKSNPGVERILPPPEEPLKRPVAPPAPVAADPPVALPPAVVPAPVTAEPVPAAAPAPAPAAPVAPTPTTAAATPPAPAVAGGTRLQIGALRSDEAARQEWDRLKRIHSDLLGGLSATISKIDIPDRGVFYRIHAGPITDASKIDNTCGELKRRSVPCIIVR